MEGEKKFPVIRGPKEVVERIIKALKEVYDPEIPVNIYDLGLVYEINVEGDPKKPIIHVVITLTAVGCPVAGVLAAYVEEAIRDAVPEAQDIIVDVTFDPPWSPDYVTEEGREMLKAIFGYDVVEEWKKRMEGQLPA
ncbi:MAG: metal-sulfur cluster assembly factor [Desulfurococcales archaeon]|nr:metal-sulfur cluster assembly factor [Desulfurococcales archaeon]